MGNRLLFAFLLLLASGASGATYYVRTDGNDGNNGLADTAEGAKLTVNGAHALTVAGDTVFIRDGEHQATASISRSGTAAAPITYIGTTNAWLSRAVTISGNYIVMEGMRFGKGDAALNSGTASVVITGATNVLTGNLFDPGGDREHGCQSVSIEESGAGNVVKNFKVHNFNHSFCFVTTTGTVGNTFTNGLISDFTDGDGFQLSGAFHKVQAVEFTGLTKSNLDVHTDFIQTPNANANSHDMLIENCYLHDYDGQIGYLTRVNESSSTNQHSWTVRNNVFDSVTSFLRLSIPQVKIYNNTFYSGGTVQGWHLELGGAPPEYDSTGAEIFNNVFVTDETPWIVNGAGSQDYTHGYNFMVNEDFSAKTFTTGGTETGRVNSGNPQFLDAASGNLRIGATSALIGNGTVLSGFTTDADGVVRGETWDIGAYEFEEPPAAVSGSATAVRVNVGTLIRR